MLNSRAIYALTGKRLERFGFLPGGVRMTGSANANFGICGNDFGGEKPGISNIKTHSACAYRVDWNSSLPINGDG